MNHEKCVRARGVEGERARLTWSVLVLIASSVRLSRRPCSQETGARPPRTAAGEAVLPRGRLAAACGAGSGMRSSAATQLRRDVGWAVVRGPTPQIYRHPRAAARRTARRNPTSAA